MLSGDERTNLPMAARRKNSLYKLLPMPEAKFKVLEEAKVRELNRLKRRGSHLALGVYYACEGMAAEAEKEFQILIDNNPQSPIAQRLLRIIESWK